MKKLIVVLAVFLVTMQVSAVELFNGFTTDMGVNEVRARARAVLSLKSNEIIRTKADLTHGRKSHFRVFSDDGDKANLNNQFPAIETSMVCNSSLPAFASTPFAGMANIFFYFYNDKLFAVTVFWSMRGTDVLEGFKETYGNKYGTMVETETLQSQKNASRYHTWEPAGMVVITEYGVQVGAQPIVGPGISYFIDTRFVKFMAGHAR
jgi:hypothetical protein